MRVYSMTKSIAISIKTAIWFELADIKVWVMGPAFIGGQIQTNERTTDDSRFDISWNTPLN